MRKITLNEICPKPKPPEVKVNNILILNDRSGSMMNLRGRVTEETTKKIKEIQENARATGIKTQICLGDFSNKRYFSSWMDAEAATYTPKIDNQGTNLNLSVSNALDTLLSAPKVSENDNSAYLLLVMTDGYDESDSEGRSVSVGQLGNKIASLAENVTITLMGPNTNYTIDWTTSVGIPRDNVILWDGKTEDSYGSTMSVQSVGLGNYYYMRSAGGSSTQNFYTVAPNKIQDHEIKALKVLDPKDFAVLENREDKIELKPFVEKNGFKFLKGANYYQLLKPEKIQSDKDFLIMDKSGKVYGGGNSGADIRRFLGLPTTGTILVHPVTGEYTIFVQSNSNNRKLISWNDKNTGERRVQKVVVLK